MQPSVPPSVTLDPNEKVLRKVNRYWTELVPSTASAMILIFAAIGIIYGYGRYHDSFSFINGGWVAILAILFIGLSCLILFSSVWVYKQNCLILTNMHLIQVVQSGLFNRQTSQLSLAKVQDVTGKRAGFVATILNFGDVVVQTAADSDQFVFHNAPAPQELADACLAAHEQFVAAGSAPFAVAEAPAAAVAAVPVPAAVPAPVEPVPAEPTPAEPMPMAPAAEPEPISEPEPRLSPEPAPESEPAETVRPQGPQTLEPGETASLAEFGAGRREDDEDEL